MSSSPSVGRGQTREEPARQWPCNDHAADWRGEHEPHDWERREGRFVHCPGRRFTREQRWDQALSDWTVFVDADGHKGIRGATEGEVRANCMALADSEQSDLRSWLAAAEARVEEVESQLASTQRAYAEDYAAQDDRIGKLQDKVKRHRGGRIQAVNDLARLRAGIQALADEWPGSLNGQTPGAALRSLLSETVINE